jgi:hypothetical protein
VTKYNTVSARGPWLLGRSDDDGCMVGVLYPPQMKWSAISVDGGTLRPAITRNMAANNLRNYGHANEVMSRRGGGEGGQVTSETGTPHTHAPHTHTPQHTHT